MQDPSEPIIEPANLRFLRRLVTVLTATMIIGLFTIIVMFVIRFPSIGTKFPDTVTLPAGVTATAYTQGADWFAVVTDNNQILIFDREGETLRQTIDIVPAP